MMDLIRELSTAASRLSTVAREVDFSGVRQFLVYLVCINLLIFGANLVVWGVWLGRRLVCTNRGMGPELNLNGGEQYFLQAVRWLLGQSRTSLGNIRREFGCSKDSTFSTSAYWMLWGFFCVPLGGVGVVCSVVCSAVSSFMYACLAVAFFSAGNVIFLLSGVVAFFSQAAQVPAQLLDYPRAAPRATAPELDDQGGSGAGVSIPWPAPARKSSAALRVLAQQQPATPPEADTAAADTTAADTPPPSPTKPPAAPARQRGPKRKPEADFPPGRLTRTRRGVYH